MGERQDRRLFVPRDDILCLGRREQVDVLEARSLLRPVSEKDIQTASTEARMCVSAEGLLRKLQLHVPVVSSAYVHASGRQTVLSGSIRRLRMVG